MWYNKGVIHMNIPKDWQELLETFEVRGFRALVVGGAVRDFLLGRRVYDLDVATSARPEEVAEILHDDVNLRHAKYGAAKGSFRGISLEVSTFRREVYRGNRRPEVIFVKTFDEEVFRRDFTVNAMGLDLRGALHDPLGGLEDLGHKTLRLIGEKEARFSEDPLRLLRLLRFRSSLGFSIEEETEAAFCKNWPLVKTLSTERTSEELFRLLLGGEVDDTVSWMEERGCFEDLLGATCREGMRRSLGDLPKDGLLRLGGLCLRLGRPFPEVTVPRRRRREKGAIADLVKALPPPGEEGTWLRAHGGFGRELLSWMRRKLPPLEELALTGADLRALGVPEGPEIGCWQKRLHALVDGGEIENRKELLLEVVRLEREDG